MNQSRLSGGRHGPSPAAALHNTNTALGVDYRVVCCAGVAMWVLNRGPATTPRSGKKSSSSSLRLQVLTDAIGGSAFKPLIVAATGLSGLLFLMTASSFLPYEELRSMASSSATGGRKGWSIGRQRVEYMPCPAMGIDVEAPRFGWIVERSSNMQQQGGESSSRSVVQESFRVVVTDADRGEEVVWDSGRVQSHECRHVPYGAVGGQAVRGLRSHTTYHWVVTTWLSNSSNQDHHHDDQGSSRNNKIVAVVESRKAVFVTGILREDDWEGARWLTGADRGHNLCRQEFRTPPAQAIATAEGGGSNQHAKGRRRRAVLLVAGLGMFRATINGVRVSDAELEAGTSDFSKRVHYSTYDVTQLIHWGDDDHHENNNNTNNNNNVLGLSLGNGWYASDGGQFSAAKGGGDPLPATPRVFLAKLVVIMQQQQHEAEEEEDGGATTTTTTTRTVAGTTSSSSMTGGGQPWMCHEGPITYDSIFNGETYDARIEAQVRGWDVPGYDASGWAEAVEATDGKRPAGRLVAPKMQPVRKIEALRAVSISEEVGGGAYVVDFGQNFAGWIALTLHLRGARGASSYYEEGDRVVVRHAEVLQHEGNVKGGGTPTPGAIYTDNLRAARQQDTYIMAADASSSYGEGGLVVVWEPTFTYHGFRYVEIRGLKGQPLTTEDVVGHVVHTDAAQTGAITFQQQGGGGELLNRLQQAIVWGQRANLVSIPTDCPQRDERRGWLGDVRLVAEEALLNLDSVAPFIKFLHDITDTQDENGDITDTAPDSGMGGRPADPSWGAALPALVYYLWRETGDVRVVEEFYGPVARYVRAVLRGVKDTGLANIFTSYGDWVAVRESPVCSSRLASSFSLLESLSHAHALALVVGRRQDAEAFHTQAAILGHLFHATFFKDGTYDNGVQTCTALPLWLGNTVVAGGEDGSTITKQLAQSLVHDVAVVHGWHVTTGIIGLKYMLEVLSRLGRDDVVVRVLQQTTYPSFGYMLTNALEPATSLWELWDSPTQDGGMNSRNHIMFGSVGSWFYKYLGGIRAVAAATIDDDEVVVSKAGYREVVVSVPLNPCLPLGGASTWLMTPLGRLAVDWQRVASSSSSWWWLRGRQSVVWGVKLRVTVPVGAIARVRLDGRPWATAVAATRSTTRVNGVDVKQQSRRRGLGVTVGEEGAGGVQEVRVGSGTWDFDVTYEQQQQPAKKRKAGSRNRKGGKDHQEEEEEPLVEGCLVGGQAAGETAAVLFRDLFGADP